MVLIVNICIILIYAICTLWSAKLSNWVYENMGGNLYMEYYKYFLEPLVLHFYVILFFRVFMISWCLRCFWLYYKYIYDICYICYIQLQMSSAKAQFQISFFVWLNYWLGWFLWIVPCCPFVRPIPIPISFLLLF